MLILFSLAFPFLDCKVQITTLQRLGSKRQKFNVFSIILSVHLLAHENFSVLVALPLQGNTMFPDPQSVSTQLCCSGHSVDPKLHPISCLVHRAPLKYPKHLLQTSVILSDIKQLCGWFFKVEIE